MRLLIALLLAAAAAVAQSPRDFPVHIWGRIESVGQSGFVVDQNYNADPHSAYRRQNRRILLDAHTRFEDSARQDLRAGRDVDIMGANDGSAVRATRVVVYEGNRPVRMPAGARVIQPNGSLRSLR